MGRFFGSRKKPDGGRALEGLLDRAAQAFEDGDWEAAREAAEQALALSPRSVEAHHYLGAARLELGDVEGAREAFARGHAQDPDDGELALAYAELLVGALGEERERVQEGLAVCTRARKKAERTGDAELELELLLLEGTACNQLGENRAALEALDALLSREPSSVDAQVERGLALFELCRFEEAEKALRQVVERIPDEPWAHHTLGLLAERRGADKDARRAFARARQLGPDEFFEPVKLGDEAFDSVVEDALRQLPADVKKYLENVTVAVEPFPPTEDLLAQEPPLSPTILGMFRGTPVGERSVTRSEDHFPAAIVLYQRNLERFVRTREELIEQIGITVMHEFGHLIGLDEEDLWERGLD